MSYAPTHLFIWKKTYCTETLECELQSYTHILEHRQANYIFDGDEKTNEDDIGNVSFALSDEDDELVGM